MIQIQVFQNISANFNQEIDLDGQIVQINIAYNSRNNFFHINEFIDQDENIITGVKIVPEWLLFDNYKGLVDFEGDLIVLKQDEDAGNDITYDNFGNGWDLFYLTPDEVETWKQANGL